MTGTGGDWNHGILWLCIYFHIIYWIYWEFHHPNWRIPSFFRGVGWNHQPDDLVFKSVLGGNFYSMFLVWIISWDVHHENQPSSRPLRSHYRYSGFPEEEERDLVASDSLWYSNMACPFDVLDFLVYLVYFNDFPIPPLKKGISQQAMFEGQEIWWTSECVGVPMICRRGWTPIATRVLLWRQGTRVWICEHEF